MILKVLADGPRTGAPPRFEAHQVAQIFALACEPPEKSGVPFSHWTPGALAQELVKRGIVDSISARQVGRFLEGGRHPAAQGQVLAAKHARGPGALRRVVRTICELYEQATTLHEQGVHLISCDERTGIQALEHARPALPVRPGRIERIEYEDVRHGTLCLTANLEIATGHIVSPTIGARRTEQDFVDHIARTIDGDPDARWIFVLDNLNTHNSEALVRFVASRCGLDVPLGAKGESGVLRTMETRAAFLSDPSHRIRFVYTPKHCSWLNQIEIWFSILVRRLSRRASVSSLDHLHEHLSHAIGGRCCASSRAGLLALEPVARLPGPEEQRVDHPQLGLRSAVEREPRLQVPR